MSESQQTSKRGLTVRELGKLVPGDHADGKIPGLVFRVRQTGGRSWAYRYRNAAGRLRRLTLGSYPALGLANARVAARAARKAVSLGRDPAGERRRAREADTFGALAERYIERWAKPRKKTWQGDVRMLNRHVLPRWKHVPAQEIKRRDVRELIEKVADSGPTAANRVRALLSKVFNFGIAVDAVETNPVTGTIPNRERARDRVLSEDELRAVWDSGNTILRLILATVQRPENVKGLRWSEFSDGAWTIPASRFKTRSVHVVPISSLALEILESVPQVDGRDELFSVREAKGVTIDEELVYWRRYLKSLGVPDAQPKDLQRTARSLLSKIGVSPDIAERVQGHALPGMRGVYDVHDYFAEKRVALERLATELRRIVSGETKVADVVRLR